MTQKEDVAIEEIRAVRHAISAEFGHDTQKLVDHYIEIQKKYADRVEKAPKTEPRSADLITS